MPIYTISRCFISKIENNKITALTWLNSFPDLKCDFVGEMEYVDLSFPGQL